MGFKITVISGHEYQAKQEIHTQGTQAAKEDTFRAFNFSPSESDTLIQVLTLSESLPLFC